MLKQDLTVDLTTSIEQIKSPAHRINILMPVLACLFLAAWLITLVRGSTTDLKSDNRDLRIEIQQINFEKEKLRTAMQTEINEINNKRYQESQEQVKRLQKIYSEQTHVKKAIQKIRK